MYDDIGFQEDAVDSAAISDGQLTARIEPFDSFWEGPEDVEKGYYTFGQFYRSNYLEHIPANKEASILVVSCGPGYFVNLLAEEGYRNVLGIDSYPEKVKYAQDRGLNCRVAHAFPFLENTQNRYDVIFCEQELNHLTKDEIVRFLRLCWNRLNSGGTFICHVLNASNPITGADALAQNFDHFNTFTEYTLRQVLEYCDFHEIRVLPLNLYVFYKNPLNYVAWLVATFLTLIFRASFVLYGKSNKTFTKKIGGVAKRKTS